jgi:Ser/Thr protein kinase RdoA (MazF antagonist)
LQRSIGTFSDREKCRKDRVEQSCLQTIIEENEAVDLVAAAIGVRPLRAVRQSLSKSGKAVFRMDLADGQSVALRLSVRPRTFAYTQHNLDVLRKLGLPVPMVLAAGPTASGGSYIVLNWIPGRDLVRELGGMSREQMTELAEQLVEFQRRVAGLPQNSRFGWAPIGRTPALQEWGQVFGEAGSPAVVDEISLLGQFRVRLRRVRSRLEPYFRSVRPLCFLDDLTLTNVLVAAGALHGIIDVDFVCYGDPLLAVGATLAGIASDVGERGSFYGAELVRLWNPNELQLQCIWFYSALWTIGLLSLTDATAEPARADGLIGAAKSSLHLAETISQ